MSANPQLTTTRNRATEAGKHRSSLIAYRHGLTGHTIILPAQDMEAYQNFNQQFFHDLKPVGILEIQLVQSLADTSWRLNRIPALECNLLSLGFWKHEIKISTEHPEAHAALVIVESLRDEIRTFNALSQHGARLAGQFERTVRLLGAIQSARRRQPPQNKELL
jgi:hypothetical protein